MKLQLIKKYIFKINIYESLYKTLRYIITYKPKDKLLKNHYLK